MKKLIMLVLLSISLLACKSLESNKELNGNKKIILENEITIKNKGTKSEGSEGKLKINTYYLPDIFTLISDSEKTYSFSINNAAWGKHKYFPLDNKIPDKISINKINKEILNIGFYEGEEKLINTPNSWLFIQWKTGSAYIDSEKLSTILAQKPFSDIKSLNPALIELSNKTKIK